MKTRSTLQDWVMDLTFMQQSVLLAALRGPDTVDKNHVAKLVLRWYRRCVLISAFDREPIMNPVYQGGGSFTGPSLQPCEIHGHREHIGLADKWVAWQGPMTDLVKRYLAHCDEIPHHFHLHFLHGAEVLGFKHPSDLIRAWWYQTYAAMANDMHLMPESLDQFEQRLSDREDLWRAAEVVTANPPPAPPPPPPPAPPARPVDLPLRCDCYPGCWRDHSVGWPEVSRDLLGLVKANIPHGCFVIMPSTIRIAPSEFSRWSSINVSSFLKP